MQGARAHVPTIAGVATADPDSLPRFYDRSSPLVVYTKLYYLDTKWF